MNFKTLTGNAVAAMKTTILAGTILTVIGTGSALSKPLEVEVFTSDAAGFHATSTLIKGEKDAILIDAQFTLSAAHRLTAQIIESGRNLKSIFITHAHPDHYFGLEVILRQFPAAKVYAIKDVVEQMNELGPKKLQTWKPMYGANLTSAPLTAEALVGDTMTLDGSEIQIIELKEAEIEYTAMVFIPSIKTVVAGDLVYDGIHPWLAETNTARRTQWLKHLNMISALNPKVVIAGHQKPGTGLSVGGVLATTNYIHNFNKVVKTTRDADIAKQQILKKYPALALPVILDFSIQNAYAPAKAKDTH